MSFHSFAAASSEELAIVAVHAASKMRELDWVQRRCVWAMWCGNKPHHFLLLVAQHFAPDELIDGLATGRAAPEIIVMFEKIYFHKGVEIHYVD
jgi:hypothetical protein